MQKKTALYCQISFTGEKSWSNIFPSLQSLYYLGCSHFSIKRMVEYAQLGALWFSASGGEFCVILSKGLKMGLYCGLGRDVSICPFQSNPIMTQKYWFWTSKNPQTQWQLPPKLELCRFLSLVQTVWTVSATIPITQRHPYNSSASSFFPLSCQSTQLIFKFSLLPFVLCLALTHPPHSLPLSLSV